jgi:hypothetical protein
MRVSHLAIIGLATVLVGCSEMPRQSKFCVSIDGPTQPIVQVVDEFAQSKRLISGNGTVNRSYTSEDGSARIVILLRLGPNGSVVSLFERVGSKSSLKPELAGYLNSQSGRIGRITPCSAIPGFTAPQER